MFSHGGFDARASRRRLCGTEATPQALARLANADPAKTLVMDFIGQLVADGFAEWEELKSGEIELRFHTGEIYILTATAIVRLA